MKGGRKNSGQAPISQKMSPIKRSVATQTTQDQFDSLICDTIPHDLNKWSESKLSKLSINDLMLLCAKRDVQYSNAVRHLCVQRLLDWKSLNKQEELQDTIVKQAQLNNIKTSVNARMNAKRITRSRKTSNICQEHLNTINYLDSLDDTHTSNETSKQDSTNFVVEQLFFDDLSLQDK